MDRLETRELTYFLAVADELHFGRAAARLGIAQPALSKAIRQLERRLGVALFERSSRSVALTAAGQILVREGRHALDAVSAAARHAQRAGADQPRIVLAMKPGGDAGLLPAILAAYAREPQSLPVEMMYSADRTGLLRDGRADAALLHHPFDDLTGLDAEPLLTEPTMAVLPVTNPLAGRADLCLADLSSESVYRWPDRPTNMHRIGGISELLQLVALGQTIALLPRSLTTPLPDDLARVPVTDAAPITLLLAWPAHSRSPAIAALARASTAAALAHTNR